MLKNTYRCTACSSLPCTVQVEYPLESKCSAPDRCLYNNDIPTNWKAVCESKIDIKKEKSKYTPPGVVISL